MYIRGELYITGCFFVCLKVDRPINGVGEGSRSREGRKAYNQKFTVLACPCCNKMSVSSMTQRGHHCLTAEYPVTSKLYPKLGGYVDMQMCHTGELKISTSCNTNIHQMTSSMRSNVPAVVLCKIQLSSCEKQATNVIQSNLHVRPPFLSDHLP